MNGEVMEGEKKDVLYRRGKEGKVRDGKEVKYKSECVRLEVLVSILLQS